MWAVLPEKNKGDLLDPARVAVHHKAAVADIERGQAAVQALLVQEADGKHASAKQEEHRTRLA